MGTVASRTSLLSACQTASKPCCSAYRAYPIPSRMGCLSWRYRATRPWLVTATALPSRSSRRARRFELVGPDVLETCPQPLGRFRAHGRDRILIDPSHSAVGHHQLAVHHDVADMVRTQAERPVPGHVVRVDGGRSLVVEHDE